MTTIPEELEQWVVEMSDFRLPRWADLPELDLYLEQVITLVENYLTPLIVGEEKFITTSMVHNYVKHKVMPAPIKKKYTKRHVAYLIAITTLKQVVTLPEISDGITYQGMVMDAHEAYDLLCEEIENGLQDTLIKLGKNEKAQAGIFYDNAPPQQMALRMAVIAFVSKCVTKKLIVLERKYVLSREEEGK